MKKYIILSLGLMIFFLQGCIVKSLHPFYKPDDVVFRKELLNKWKDQEGERWEISSVENDPNAYQLDHFSNEGKVDAVFVAHMFRLNDVTYLDFYPIGSDQNNNEVLDMHLMPTHSIARVEMLKSNEVRIRWLNEEWLHELFEQNRIKISHEVVNEGVSTGADAAYVLTATTEELQKFIIKYGGEEKAFEGDNTVGLVLTR